MVTFQDVQDAPWMSQENEDLSYSLPVYWSDKSSHGDVLTSSVFPQLATWTTRLVLLYYNDHFPWEWLQGQAGVEEKTGFWDLMISQWLITVPCLLILLFGIGIFTFLVYYYCCKKEKALTKASLRDHKQHRKWAVSLLFVGSCLTILPSAMLFQQTVDPVLRYGVTTLANISIFTLEDLQIYKNKIGIDVKYFFNEYLIKNFETLINYDNIVEVLQSGVNYGNLSEAVSERLVQIEDNLSQISGIKLNLSDIFNTTSALAEDMAMQVESLDDSLVRLQNSCHMISRVACYNHTDILFAPPQTDMMEVFIDQLHSTLTYIDLERLENVAKLHKHLTSKLLRQNSITASISDIQSALIQDGRYFDTRYDVEQHLSESGEFIEKSKLTWENVNYLQTKHFTVAYLSFLTMTLTAAGYSIVLLFSFLFAVSGVRYSEFPCYRRSYLSTYSANIMSIANNLVIFLVLPVAVCTAAALIGGTMATVLADAVKTYTIFDYWVDRLPSINHIFTVDDFILHIPSYKTLVQLCAANNPGLLSVINATLPNITISLMQLIPTKSNILSDTKFALTQVSTDVFKDLTNNITEFTNLNIYPNISQQLVDLQASSSTGIFAQSSSYYGNVAQYYNSQAQNLSNADIKNNLLSLSRDYQTNSETLGRLETKQEQLNLQINLIAAETARMIQLFQACRAQLQGVLQTIEKFNTDLMTYVNSSDVAQVVDAAYNRFLFICNTFLERSLAVFRNNMGRCGHFTYIYDIFNQVFQTLADRYANIMWLILLVLLLSLSAASIANVLIYKYFGTYIGIELLPEDELLRRKSAASSVGLGTVTDEPLSPYFNKDQLRKDVERLLVSRLQSIDVTPQQVRQRGPSLSTSKGKEQGRLSLKHPKPASTRRARSMVHFSDEKNGEIYNSETDLKPGVKLYSLDDLSLIDVSLKLSEASTPLVYPSDEQLIRNTSAQSIVRHKVSSSRTHGLEYKGSGNLPTSVTKAPESVYYDLNESVSEIFKDSFTSLYSPFEAVSGSHFYPQVSLDNKTSKATGKTTPEITKLHSLR